jgi:co-chaperonin GroES (HSP10)
MKALDVNVIVRQLQPKKTVSGGFKIPEANQVRPNRGEVISVGAEVSEIKVGDVALFDGGFGLVIEENGEMLRILNKRNIFAIE